MVRFFRWLVQPQHWLAVMLAAVPVVLMFNYALTNTFNFPIGDGARSIPYALQVADGELAFSDLFEPAWGHISFFNNSMTALLTLWTNWNYNYEVYFNLLVMCVIYGLFIVLMYETQPEAVYLALFPMALLAFTMRQMVNVVIGYNGQWFLIVLFVLLMVWSMVRLPDWRGVLLAVIFAAASSISTGGGVVAWGVLATYLILTRFPLHWKVLYFGLCVAGALGTLYLLRSAGVFVSSAEAVDAGLNLSVQALLQIPLRMILYFGVVFDGTSTVTGAWVMGLLGLVAYGLNVVYVARHNPQTRLLNIWFAVMAASMGVSIINTIARPLSEISAAGLYAAPYHTTPVLMFWAAVFASIAMACYITLNLTGRRAIDQAYLLANISLFVLLVGMHIPQAARARFGNAFNGACLEHVVFYQEFREGCFYQIPAFFPITAYNQLAERRLTHYASVSTENILSADDDNPVLIETNNAWRNLFIRDYFLDGVAHERLIHVYPTQTLDATMLTPPLPHFDLESATVIEDLLDELRAVDSFWYVRPFGEETALTALIEALQAEDYFLLDTQRRGANWLVSRIAYIPETTANAPVFGGDARLRVITQIDETITRCDVLNVRSLWAEESEIVGDYSASLKLLTSDGEQVAQSDAQLSTVGTNSWIENELYLDERTLAIPCDLPPGEYNLALSVYFYQAPNELFAVDGVTVSGFDDLALIRTITVR